MNSEYAKLIGEGAYGKVYKVKNANIAIKERKSNYGNFLKEGEILQSLQHVKYFPHLYMFNRNEIVMEYIPGTLLSDWLQEGNLITQNLLQQIYQAYEMCLLTGIRPVELEPDHIILKDNIIKIIDCGSYKKISPLTHPHALKMELEDFSKQLLHWIDFWSRQVGTTE